MSVDDRLVAVVREWLVKAEHDLAAAAHLLTMGMGCPAEIVCFHAQQCVEKYLKAVLILSGVDFPKTHDLERLVDLLPKEVNVGLSAGEQAELTDYATGVRYPGSGEIPLADAKRALRIARRVRQRVRAWLPGKAKRRARKPQA